MPTRQALIEKCKNTRCPKSITQPNNVYIHELSPSHELHNSSSYKKKQAISKALKENSPQPFNLLLSLENIV